MEYFLSVTWELIADNSFAVLVIITVIISRLTKNRGQTVISSVLLALLLSVIKDGISGQMIISGIIIYVLALMVTYNYRTSG
jgi:hypothetical protein